METVVRALALAPPAIAPPQQRCRQGGEQHGEPERDCHQPPGRTKRISIACRPEMVVLEPPSRIRGYATQLAVGASELEERRGRIPTSAGLPTSDKNCGSTVIFGAKP